MAITEIKDTDKLIDSVSVLNNNFNSLNNDKANSSDVYTKTETDNRYLKLSGGTVSGTVTHNGAISFTNTNSEINKNANKELYQIADRLGLIDEEEYRIQEVFLNASMDPAEEFDKQSVDLIYTMNFVDKLFNRNDTASLKNFIVAIIHNNKE